MKSTMGCADECAGKHSAHVMHVQPLWTPPTTRARLVRGGGYIMTPAMAILRCSSQRAARNAVLFHVALSTGVKIKYENVDHG